MGNIEFAWDNRKARSSLLKHGISFEEAQTVFSDENVRILQGNGGRTRHALSKPDQFVSERLRGAEAVPHYSLATGRTGRETVTMKRAVS